MAVMATVAKGYDLDYAWRAVGEANRGAGYYLAATEAGEPPGTWWGPGAERLGLAVLLDVVYNHFGPDGNYTGVYSPYYISRGHRTPWGDALNFDGLHSAAVREPSEPSMYPLSMPVCSMGSSSE